MKALDNTWCVLTTLQGRAGRDSTLCVLNSIYARLPGEAVLVGMVIRLIEALALALVQVLKYTIQVSWYRSCDLGTWVSSSISPGFLTGAGGSPCCRGAVRTLISMHLQYLAHGGPIHHGHPGMGCTEK